MSKRTTRGAAMLSLVLATAACGGPEPGPGGCSVDAADDPVRLVCPSLTVEFARDPYRMTILSGTGTLTREQANGPFYERGTTVVDLVRVTAARGLDDGVELDVATREGSTATVTARLRSPRDLVVTLLPPTGPGAITALGNRFASPADERIYGLTGRLRDSPPLSPPLIEVPIDDVQPQEVGSLDRRGETVEMLVRPTFGLYTPFYHSSRGYGLYVEGTTIGAFDLARTDPGTVSFRFEAPSPGTAPKLAFHVFVGPGHAEIVDAYTALTGRPFVPADWAFLHWRWHDLLQPGQTGELDGETVQHLVAEDVAMYDKLGIPAGVYHFDRPTLSGEYGFARFDWDPERLPNADRMLASLRSRGFRISSWSSTWTCGSEPGDNGTAAAALGHMVPGPGGTPKCSDTDGNHFILDVTSEAARTWFAGRVSDFVRRYDIDSIKLDRGEEHIPTEATDVFADGRNGREVRNDYPNLQALLHRQALAAVHPDGDFSLISRAGYAGAQKDTIVWGGDIPGSEMFGTGAGTDLGLRSAIISQQRAAFMGFPIWGSDTGGYYEFRDRDVFARWIQFSTFSGIMEIGGIGDHAPWKMPTEPAYDTEMIDIYKRYVVLRHALQPYIVAAAREAGRTGMPIVRPLVFAFRDDPAVANLWDQYLFGPDLLVAPVWRIGQRSREVYLPRGTWRNYWNDAERFEGPTTLTVDVPLDSIPVFVRGDAAVPR